MAEDQNNSCLIAEVIIDQNIPLVLSYEVPIELQDKIHIGCRCQIPFRAKTLKGFVFSLGIQTPTQKLKRLLAISDEVSISVKLLELALWMSRYYVTPLPRVLHFFVPKILKNKDLDPIYTQGEFIQIYEKDIFEYLKTHHPRKKKLLSFVKEALNEKKNLALKEIKKKLGSLIYEEFISKGFINFTKKSHLLDFESLPTVKKTLTHDQELVASNLKKALEEKRESIHLLYGVCGSGKTEVYCEAIEKAISLGLGIIYLVPEVSLAPQTLMRLKKRFNVPMALLHHKVSDGIKKQDWEALHAGQITFVIGARSAIFAPVKNLGLIIIDEEHEGAYKQEGMPTYHTKDVAIMRARIEKAMVILGSATPSLESYYQSLQGKITLHTLKSRPHTFSMPEINLASLGTDFQKAQGLHLFAEPTLRAIEDNFKRGEQTLIFINRRGYNALQQCSSCAEAIKCHSCSMAMTYHKNQALLVCHFCGFSQTPPQTCPQCSESTLQFKGIGTQLVEERLQYFLKNAKILRVDKDTTKAKGSIDNYFETFSSGKADILIGTQMIAKGLDFSHLTLAIILNIDGAFNRPDFRAHEEAFQLMTQVAGRAGRSFLKGQVFIQTLNTEHPLCLKAKSGNYESFYESEIKERQEYSYPPFSRLIRFLFSDSDKNRLLEYGMNFRQKLCYLLPSNYHIQPLLPCAHEMIESNFRYHLLIKGKEAVKLYQLIQQIDKELKIPASLKRIIDVDPISTYF